MKNARTYIILLILGCALSIGMCYVFVFRSYVALAYEGNAPQWFQQLIDFLYPRFQIEKQRFELSFFLYKADQVLIRSFLVLLSISLLLWLKSPKKLLEHYIRRHSKQHYRLLTTLFYVGLLYYTWDWVFDFEQIVRMQPFYKGILLYRMLHLPILPLSLYYVLYALYILSVGLLLFRYREVLCAAIAAAILVLFQGYFFSFEKIEHGHVTLTYAAMLMPALLYELNSQSNAYVPGYVQQSSWSLFLIQLSIAGAYFLAGLEKLLTSGLEWASSETFRTYIALHDQTLGMMIAANDFLAHLLPWGALFFQLSFILILFQTRWKYPFLLMGIVFHLGTKILMDIGPYFSSWIFVYIFFIDWDRLLKWWDELTASRHKHTQKGA